MANVTHTEFMNTTAALANESNLFIAVFATSLTLIMIAAIFGSWVLVIAVYRKPKLRTRTNMFILNLAIADIGVSLFCLPFSVVTSVRQQWIFGEILCQLNGFLNILFASTSMLTLTAIGIEKYFAIVKPLHKVITYRRAVLMLVWTWLQPLAFATLPLLGFTSYKFKPGLTQCSVQDPSSLGQIIHAVVVFLVVYFVPLTIMGFTYFSILKSVHFHAKRIKKTSITYGLNSSTAQKQIAVTIFIMFVVFILCWSPYFSYIIYVTFNRSTVAMVTRRRLGLAAYWCAFLNSALDPYIYGLRNPNFRSSFKNTFTQLCCWCYSLRMLRRKDCHASNSKASLELTSNPGHNGSSSQTSCGQTQYSVDLTPDTYQGKSLTTPFSDYVNVELSEGERNRLELQLQPEGTPVRTRRSGLITTELANRCSDEGTLILDNLRQDYNDFTFAQNSPNKSTFAFEKSSESLRNLPDSIGPERNGPKENSKGLDDMRQNMQQSRSKLRWSESALLKPHSVPFNKPVISPTSDVQNPIEPPAGEMAGSKNKAFLSSSSSSSSSPPVQVYSERTVRKSNRRESNGTIMVSHGEAPTECKRFHVPLKSKTSFGSCYDKPSLLDSTKKTQKPKTRKIIWIESYL